MSEENKEKQTEEKKEKDWYYWYKRIKSGVDIYNYIKGDDKKKDEEKKKGPRTLPHIEGAPGEVPENLSLGLKALLIIGAIVVASVGVIIRCVSG